MYAFNNVIISPIVPVSKSWYKHTKRICKFLGGTVTWQDENPHNVYKKIPLSRHGMLFGKEEKVIACFLPLLEGGGEYQAYGWLIYVLCCFWRIPTCHRLTVKEYSRLNKTLLGPMLMLLLKLNCQLTKDITLNI